MKLKIGKIIKGAAKVVAENPNKVKLVAAGLGLTLPTLAVKALDIADAAKRKD